MHDWVFAMPAPDVLEATGDPSGMSGLPVGGFLDIHAVMGELAESRPVFHSEADFQFALAWLMQRRFPSADVRLEYKPAYVDRRGYLDVWLQSDEGVVAIEPKYFTRQLRMSHRGEAFDLVDQSAGRHR